MKREREREGGEGRGGRGGGGGRGRRCEEWGEVEREGGKMGAPPGEQTDRERKEEDRWRRGDMKDNRDVRSRNVLQPNGLPYARGWSVAIATWIVDGWDVLFSIWLRSIFYFQKT